MPIYQQEGSKQIRDMKNHVHHLKCLTLKTTEGFWNSVYQKRSYITIWSAHTHTHHSLMHQKHDGAISITQLLRCLCVCVGPCVCECLRVRVYAYVHVLVFQYIGVCVCVCRSSVFSY